MIGKVAIAAVLTVFVAGAAYAAYPCITLYRLDEAVATGNARTLRRLIDWPRVRVGIEADLARSERRELAPFGTAFMRNVAVKNSFTPEAVLAELRTAANGPEDGTRLRWATVEGPRQVVLDLGTVRLRLELRGATWRVTRAWLPDGVLERARTVADAAQPG